MSPSPLYTDGNSLNSNDCDFTLKLQNAPFPQDLLQQLKKIQESVDVLGKYFKKKVEA